MKFISAIHVIKRLTLAGAIAVSLVSGIVASPAAFAVQSNDAMGMAHDTADISACLNQHRTPTAPLAQELKQGQHEQARDPVPPQVQCYLALQRLPFDQKQTPENPIYSPSYLPPDIIVLTANLRI